MKNISIVISAGADGKLKADYLGFNRSEAKAEFTKIVEAGKVDEVFLIDRPEMRRKLPKVISAAVKAAKPSKPAAKKAAAK
tara:strand:- start:19 stop:261 length:243 start_codon:yes stop_codon:yes gene_type:complete